MPNRINFVLLTIEIICISLAIIFPQYVPFILIGLLIFISAIFFPKILPYLLIFIIGFNEILPGFEIINFSINPIQILILLILFVIFVDTFFNSSFPVYLYNNAFSLLTLLFFIFCFL